MRAPMLQSQAHSSDDEEYELVNHDRSNKKSRYSLKKKIDQPENVYFLHKYFKDAKPPTSMSPSSVELLLKKINKSILG
jgi:hypothetical protein